MEKSQRERERGEEEETSFVSSFCVLKFCVLKFFVHVDYYSHAHSKSGLNRPSDRNNNNNTASVSRGRFF